MWGSFNKTHIKNLDKLHARAGRIFYAWVAMGHKCWRCLNANWMGQFGNNVQSAINLVLFKCIKGYTLMECKDLFLQRNSRRRRLWLFVLTMSSLKQEKWWKGSEWMVKVKAKSVSSFSNFYWPLTTDKLFYNMLWSQKIIVDNCTAKKSFNLLIALTHSQTTLAWCEKLTML